MLDKIITTKLSLWAQRGLNDGIYTTDVRDFKKDKGLSKIKQKVSQKSVSEQLSLF